MGVGGGSVRATGKTRSTAAVQPLGDGECVLLRGAQRLFMAHVAARVSALGECVSHLPAPAAGGKFEQMHDRLRELWRSREERAPEPSAAVLDAQSTRSSPQGGPSGAGRSRAEEPSGYCLVPANVRSRRRRVVREYPLEKLYVDAATPHLRRAPQAGAPD